MSFGKTRSVGSKTRVSAKSVDSSEACVLSRKETGVGALPVRGSELLASHGRPESHDDGALGRAIGSDTGLNGKRR